MTSGRGIKLRIQAVSKSFDDGDGRAVLDSISLDVREGEFLCVLGPSGCGKTTLLRISAGLLGPSSGRIVRTDENGSRPFSAMVFQDLALFPWKTVRENAELGLRIQGKPELEIRREAARWLRALHLTEWAQAYPRALSGGMRQRTALARAFISDPQVLLMDEPLGALDAALRRLLQSEIARLWEDRRTTAVFVTHSIEEALFLADRVVMMTAGPGRIKRVFEVPFPRPRPAGVRETPAFAELAGQLWALLEAELRTSMREAL